MIGKGMHRDLFSRKVWEESLLVHVRDKENGGENKMTFIYGMIMRGVVWKWNRRKERFGRYVRVIPGFNGNLLGYNWPHLCSRQHSHCPAITSIERRRCGGTE